MFNAENKFDMDKAAVVIKEKPCTETIEKML